VAELSAYLHSANDMRESLSANQLKESECSAELEALEGSIERAADKVGGCMLCMRFLDQIYLS
jgi:hypothetical protein